MNPSGGGGDFSHRGGLGCVNTQVGKFYELFDADAEIGVRELGLNYMQSSARPHAGFPEPAYNKYAEQLVPPRTCRV